MKIAIIGAMEEEVTLLRDQIEVTGVEQIANSEYTIGKMFGVDVVLLKSGIGKVNAAMSTTILLEKYRPDFLINAGSAGGFMENLSVGDIVVSEEVVHHDVDVRAFGYEVGQVPGMPKSYMADEKLVKMVMKVAGTIQDLKVEKGLIATGDIFIQTPEQRAVIQENFKNLLAGEMEAAAIAQVAYQFNVPFVIIRSLSDIAGDNSGISFETYLEKAAKNSATIIMEVVKSLQK